MKPKFFFDYIYFAVTKAYFKWDGRTGITGIISVTIIQLFPVMMCTLYVVRNVLDQQLSKKYATPISMIIGIGIIAGIALNYKKYNGRYNQLKKYWQNESKNIRLVKGLIVVMLIIGSCLSFVLLNYLPSFGPFFHHSWLE